MNHSTHEFIEYTLMHIFLAPHSFRSHTSDPKMHVQIPNNKKTPQGLEDLGVPNAVGVDPASVQTNVVLAHIGPDLTDSEVGMSASAVCDRLREKGVLAMATMPGTIRFVTHSQVRQRLFRVYRLLRRVCSDVLLLQRSCMCSSFTDEMACWWSDVV